MLSALIFLQQLEAFIYILLAIISIRYVVDWIRIHSRMSKSIFGLEKGIMQQRQASAATALMVILITAAVVFLAANYALPEVRRANAAQVAVAASKTTPTPSPTPWMVGGVDISGCTNLHATITNPKPGETVEGKVEIRGTVDVDQMTFFTIDLGKPDIPDVWNTLFTGNAAIQKNTLYNWDTTIWEPGVYHIRLVVQLRDPKANPIKSCVVPIQVLAPR
jgi:hypothetical protein